MTVVNLHLFEILMFVKNNVHAIECDTVTHSYSTRAKYHFIRPLKHRTHKYEKSVAFSGSHFYNMLPKEIKELSVPLFKKKLRTYFIENPHYTLSEFNARNGIL
jgi:hypothetical protein